MANGRPKGQLEKESQCQHARRPVYLYDCPSASSRHEPHRDGDVLLLFAAVFAASRPARRGAGLCIRVIERIIPTSRV